MEFYIALLCLGIILGASVFFGVKSLRDEDRRLAEAERRVGEIAVHDGDERLPGDKVVPLPDPPRHIVLRANPTPPRPKRKPLKVFVTDEPEPEEELLKENLPPAPTLVTHDLPMPREARHHLFQVRKSRKGNGLC
jgi:hypothetical protein